MDISGSTLSRTIDAMIIIGAIAAYYMVSLQVQYGVTTKVISEMISPKLHPEAMEKVYNHIISCDCTDNY
jgi:hypothetical protein